MLRILKFFALLSVMLLEFSKIACAGQNEINQYSALVSSKNYQIECDIIHNDKVNAQHGSFRKNVVVSQINDKQYVHSYNENTGDKKLYYFFVKRFSEPNREVFARRYSDKPINIKKIDWSQSTIERWFMNGSVDIKLRNEIQNTYDELFSMLGPISEANNKLKYYKVQYKQSGRWQKNGVVYDFDDYDLVEPIPGILRMCYANGELKMCLKSQRRQLIANDGYGDYQLDEAKAVVVEFKQFDNLVDNGLFVKNM